MAVVEVVSTVTAKGQTTVPKSVRQALGIRKGDRLAFRVEDGRVTVHRVGEHHDPAIAAFLALLAKDIAASGQLGPLPPALLAAMEATLVDGDVDLDEPLEGDVEL